MTSFWLLLSSIFKWSYRFFDFAGNVMNWVLFIIAVGLFVYWCYVLIVTFGGQKDKTYHSPTEGKFPYYDPKIYKNEN